MVWVDASDTASENVDICRAPPILWPFPPGGDTLRRPCAAVLCSSEFEFDGVCGSDPDLLLLEGVSSCPGSGLVSTLALDSWRDATVRSLFALLGNDNPGKASPPVVSILFLGVGLGSTETTDLIGYTRSVT